jgi:MFS family permease
MVLGQSRWWVFCAVCLGFLLVVIEGMVVTIALPSIQADLGFSELSLIWVVNAYLVPYGGFLLIGGRLSDLFGPRRLYLLGIAVFTAASMVCGLTHSRALLLGARAVQGLGGAVVASVATSLIMNLFSEGSQRTTAVGVFNFVGLFGGAVGLLLGGTLTSLLNWRWLFLINLPLGTTAYALCLVSLPDSPRPTTTSRLDIAGAGAVTVSLLLAIYAFEDANRVGWNSVQTVTFFTGAIASLILFLYTEARVPNPILPLSLFRRRNLMVVNIILMMWYSAISAWYFASTLYLQSILKYSPQQVSFTFLPFTLAAAALSLGGCAKLITRFGTKCVSVTGTLIASVGMASFARVPLHGDLATILPGMVLVGLGGGMAGIPNFLIATKGVPPSESGFVSGVLGTASMMGSALGLATLVSAASVCTSKLLATGMSLPVALNSGYHMVFSLAAGLLAISLLIAIAFLPAEEGVREPLRT